MVPDNDSAFARLGRPVVGRIEDLVREGVLPEEPSWQGRRKEVSILLGLAERRDVLDHKVPGLNPSEHLGVLPPQEIAFILRVALAQVAEPLARRPADDNIDVGGHLRTLDPLLDGTCEDVRLREGLGVGGGGLGVYLDRGDAAEAVGRLVKARSQPTGPSEEVEDADGLATHAPRLAGTADRRQDPVGEESPGRQLPGRRVQGHGRRGARGGRQLPGRKVVGTAGTVHKDGGPWRLPWWRVCGRHVVAWVDEPGSSPGGGHVGTAAGTEPGVPR